MGHVWLQSALWIGQVAAIVSIRVTISVASKSWSESLAATFEPREGVHTTLLMSTGLIFGSISGCLASPTTSSTAQHTVRYRDDRQRRRGESHRAEMAPAVISDARRKRDRHAGGGRGRVNWPGAERSRKSIRIANADRRGAAECCISG